MELGTLIGTPLVVIFLVIGILLGGSLSQFIDGPSVMIVIGYTIAAMMIATPFKQLVPGAIKIALLILKPYAVNANEIIEKFVALSEKARRDGLLALEADVGELEEPFMKKGLQLVVDGTDPNLIRSIMDTELAGMETRHGMGKGVFINAATLAPAFGMVGTLIGLINMLAQMEDPSAIGPAMAVALITTMYGSLIANMVCNPIAFKLGSLSAEETGMREIMLEGILAIQSGDNPRIVEERLKAYLPPAERKEEEEK